MLIILKRYRIELKIIVKIVILYLLLIGCKKNKETECEEITISHSINKIMPLGASRVEGSNPDFESFRYELWKKLKQNNWTFDFIGTQCDNATYEAVNGGAFDINHEGRGGWTSGQLLDGISEWLGQTGPPDLVLFSSPGGNDLLQGLAYDDAISNVNAIIDCIQTANSEVTILIEQPAPGKSEFMTPSLTASFNQMQQDIPVIASSQTNALSKVIAVDMYTGFNDSYLADDVHYNNLGAAFIANRYYDVLIDLLKQ